jgi:ABC-type uncharacterized transport system substrate-binding protein
MASLAPVRRHSDTSSARANRAAARPLGVPCPALTIGGRYSNLTGMSFLISVLGPKQVELLHEELPAVDTIGLFGNPGNANFQVDMPDIRAAAEVFKLRLEVVNASTGGDLEAAFAIMVQHRVGAVIRSDPFLISRRKQLIELAARHTMPAIYPFRWFTDDGGLISYGSSLLDLYRQTGIYVGKILNGAKPSELPLQQSTRWSW